MGAKGHGRPVRRAVSERKARSPLMPQPAITAPAPVSTSLRKAGSSSKASFQAFTLYPTTLRAASSPLPMWRGRTRDPHEASSSRPGARRARTPPSSRTSCSRGFGPLISRSITKSAVWPARGSSPSGSVVGTPLESRGRSPSRSSASSVSMSVSTRHSTLSGPSKTAIHRFALLCHVAPGRTRETDAGAQRQAPVPESLKVWPAMGMNAQV